MIQLSWAQLLLLVLKKIENPTTVIALFYEEIVDHNVAIATDWCV